MQMEKRSKNLGIGMVVTSCGRLDLLEVTLASFFRYNTCAIEQVVLVEDSGDKRAVELVKRYYADAETIVNASRLGQIASIDLAYSRITRPLIFHCEDDWEFLRPGFVEEQAAILERHPEVSMVNGVARGVLPDMDEVLDGCPLLAQGGVSYRIIAPDAHEIWFGYSFNPGLRRSEDYRRLGLFAPLGHEADISVAFKTAGLSMAVLVDAAYTHLGEGRQVKDPVFPINMSPAFRRYWFSSRTEGKSA